MGFVVLYFECCVQVIDNRTTRLEWRTQRGAVDSESRSEI